VANFEKVYQMVALQIIQRCHGAIKITKHGKIIEVYDLKRHIWSDGLAGLIIKEESHKSGLKDWEVARCIRPRIIALLLEDKKGVEILEGLVKEINEIGEKAVLEKYQK